MSPIGIANRVAERSTSTGAGALVLSGAVEARYRTFAAAGLDGSPSYYFIVHRTAAEWECGIGITAAGTLTRTTVLSNHLGTTAFVAFSAGEKDVFNDVPSERLGTIDGLPCSPSSITVNTTIPAGYNAVSAGPVTIAEGVTVTVSDHSTWSIT